MRKIILVALAVATAACGGTPTAPETRTSAESTIRTDNIDSDSAPARGGNLMGSGH